MTGVRVLVGTRKGAWFLRTDDRRSFKIEGLGIALMDAMGGEDYTSLIGLPLIKLVRILEQFGVKVL